MDRAHLAACIAVLFTAGCSDAASGSPASSTGDATNGGDDDGGDDTGAADEPAPDPCVPYCDHVMSACTGAIATDAGLAQYASRDGCISFCQAIDPGAPGDQRGDSVACRDHHALLAKNEPAARCAFAGSTGGGVCDDDSDAGDRGRCAAFCKRTTALCTKDNGVDPVPFDASADDCLVACGAAFRFDPTAPELAQRGNTLNCRQYYLVLAYDDAGGGAPYHCQHVAFPASDFCR
jgi:hypothetical protein